MNMDCNKCNSCGMGPCGGGCRPAKYGHDFNIMANPFDSSVWNVTINGATTRVKIPKINETDTKLSTNYTAANMVYNAEKHTDTISGSQLGSLINLDDLRDVRASGANSCDLLVYRPFCNSCGEGCIPKDSQWENYHIPDSDDNILEPDSDNYYHVLTMTDCGCIEGGRIIRPSADPKILCMLDNLMNAIKPFEGDGQMIDVEGGGSTPGFEGGLNPNTGDFYIAWKDWYQSTQVAHGKVTGKLNAISTFDYETGQVTYNITSIYYDTITYNIDSNVASSRPPMVTTIWGCFPGSYDLHASHATLNSEGLKIFERSTVVALGNDYTVQIGVTFTGSYPITLNPNGGTSNWIDVMRLYNDWDVADDDGIVEVRYRNPLNWENC